MIIPSKVKKFMKNVFFFFFPQSNMKILTHFVSSSLGVYIHTRKSICSKNCTQAYKGENVEFSLVIQIFI